MYKGDITDRVAEMYLGPLKGEVDTLVLACTHYPLLKDTIGKVMGPSVKLVDPAAETANAVRKYLEDSHGLNGSAGKGEIELFLTDLPPHYLDLIRLFLGEMPDSVERVEL